jgi:CHAD domain-containing protein
MSERRAPLTVAPTGSPSSAARDHSNVRSRGVAPTDPFVTFAYATLAREVAELLESRPAAGRAPTPGEIHGLRVAARRLRVALRLFRHMLPSRDVTRFRADLRWFASSLGEVRDLDVYTDNLKAYAAELPPHERRELGGYELYLRRERADARQRAAASFASPRTEALFRDIERFVAAGPSAGALRRWRSLTVRNGIRNALRLSVGRVRRLGNRLDARSRPAELHELRIRAKRLRYELEFFAHVYAETKQIAVTCKALQDLLGSHQDVYAGTARLRRYAALLRKQGGPNSALPPALLKLRRDQLALARGVRRAFAEQWPNFLATIDAARRVGA